MKIESLISFESKILRGNVSEYIEKTSELHIASAYYKKEISKRGSPNLKRTLFCIKNNHYLYELQKKLKNNFFDYIPLSDYAYGYIKNKKYKDYLIPHQGKKYFLRLDIKDFFDSISTEKIKEVLKYNINEDIKVSSDKSLIDFITDIITYKSKLPQGAVTSPVISNIVFRYLDIRIARYCVKFNISYSRYVDDLLFSADHLGLHKEGFINMICKILKSYGFKLNNDKIIKSENQIAINGFVIEKDVRISRRKRMLLSKLLFCFKSSGGNDIDSFIETIKKEFNFSDDVNVNTFYVQHYLSGYRSFLISWLPFDSVGQLDTNLTINDKRNLQRIKDIENVLDLMVK